MKFPAQDVITKTYLEQNYKRDFLNIDCGQWTYGHPVIEVAKQDSQRKLTIGRYCSIGPNVRIFVGRQGIHQTDCLTTYPLMLAVSPSARLQGKKRTERFSASKSLPDDLDVVIGNDVWIGANVVVMAGAKIGHGAVIGAGSIVTADVPDFSVVAGSPAREIRRRHSEEVVAKILKSKWWELEPDELYEKIGENLSSSAIEDVLSLLGEQVASSIHRLTDDEKIMSFWPPKHVQEKYAGASGELLLIRTKRFVKLIENLGVFNCVPQPRILDYGCGWGRIASAINVAHSDCILDLADAWNEALDLCAANGIQNKKIKVSEILDGNDLKEEKYDAIYSFSIFTHLSKPAFDNNLEVLLNSLRSGGKLYITVRHDDFLEKFNEKNGGEPLACIGPCDFAHYFYPGCEVYGETIVGFKYLTGQFGNIKYHGLVDPFQHLYEIAR